MPEVRNYKFQLYPNRVIEARLDATMEASRWLYNYMLSKKLRIKQDMNYALTELKESEPWLNRYHSKMLQMVSTQVEGARNSLKQKKRQGYDVGELKYATRDEWNTFTYNQSGFKIERHGDTDLLWLSKIGYMEIRLHRPIDGKIKQITITRKCDRWYALVTVDKQIMPMPRLINPKKSVGIDVGISNYAYDSDGIVTPNPENLRKLERPLVRAQHRVSRRVKGSQNHKKARRWFQIVHERIARRRRDFQHKLSTHYATKYDVIFLERLRINNMVKNHSLARSIMDCAWGTFKDMIGYKAKMVVEVPAYNSTVECYRCGNKVPKGLAIRIHCCDRCGVRLHRDHNSSLVIHDRGLELWKLPMEHREVTPVEISRRSRKQEAVDVVRRLPSLREAHAFRHG